MGRSPKTPEEAPEVKRLRARQIEELAELDEEENERLKRAFSVSRGVRAFTRVPTRGNAAANAAGGRVSRPRSIVPSPAGSGTGGPATQKR